MTYPAITHAKCTRRYSVALIVAFAMGLGLGKADVPYFAANPTVKPPELLAPWSPELTMDQIELDLLWEELRIFELIEWAHPAPRVLPGNVEL